MKRIMMVGALGGIVVLLYVYARSGVICTDHSSEVFSNETDAVMQQEEEMGKSVYSNQYSMCKTLDGYEITLYDKERGFIRESTRRSRG